MRNPLEYDSPAEAIAACFLERLAVKLGLTYQEQAEVGGDSEWAWHEWMEELEDQFREVKEDEHYRTCEPVPDGCFHGYWYTYNPYKADFLLNGQIALEIDGSVHQEENQYKHDRDRDKVFAEHGIITLRYPAHLLFYREEYWKALVQTEIEHLQRTIPTLFHTPQF